MKKTEIPIWERAILTVEEASAIAGGMNEAIIRLYATKGIKTGEATFECYMTGNKLCIVKDSFIRWLSMLGRKHAMLDIESCRKELKNFENTYNQLTLVEFGKATRGRPRKNRGMENNEKII